MPYSECRGGRYVSRLRRKEEEEERLRALGEYVYMAGRTRVSESANCRRVCRGLGRGSKITL